MHKVILQQKQLVDRVVKTATANRRITHAIATSILALSPASSPNIARNPKRELGGEAMALMHGVMVMMLTVAQCLSLVQSIQNTSANAK